MISSPVRVDEVLSPHLSSEQLQEAQNEIDVWEPEGIQEKTQNDWDRERIYNVLCQAPQFW